MGMDNIMRGSWFSQNDAPVVDPVVETSAPDTTAVAPVVEEQKRPAIKSTEKPAPIEVPLIVKLDRAIEAVLIHELGNTGAAHILRAKIVAAMKNVK